MVRVSGRGREKRYVWRQGTIREYVKNLQIDSYDHTELKMHTRDGF